MIDSARAARRLMAYALALLMERKERVNWARMEFCVAGCVVVAERLGGAKRVFEAGLKRVCTATLRTE